MHASTATRRAPSARAQDKSNAVPGAARSAPGATDAAASSATAHAPFTGPPARSAKDGKPPPDTPRRTVMGHPDGAHVHGSGGGGLGTAVLVVLAAAAVVKLAGPVVAAVGELVHLALIVAGVIVGVGAIGLVGVLTWRWRRPRLDAARAMPPLSATVARAAQPLLQPRRALPQARRASELPAALQHEPPGGLHLHFHGVSAEDVAAIIARQGIPPGHVPPDPASGAARPRVGWPAASSSTSQARNARGLALA